jgi:signal transduction histidine kinase
MRWSIRYQLLVPLLMLLVGVAGISGWTAVASANRAWEQIQTQVRNVARTLSKAHYKLTETVLEQTKGLSGAEYLLVTVDGRQTTTLPTSPLPDLPTDTVAEDWQQLHLRGSISVDSRKYLCSALRLGSPDAASQGTLFILYPEALWRDALWQAIWPSLFLGSFVGLGSVVLAVGVAQRLSRRIQELERRTRQIAAGDFSPMPLSGRDDELRDLGRSVNEMAQRLAQLQEAVQKNERLRLLGQVSGGLAHQLRNGVTGAILAVQLHARECNGQGDPEALAVALRQLALLEANVKRFLDLGRSDGLCRQPCDLVNLMDEAVALLRPQCRHAHTELGWQAPATRVMLDGDSSQLRHLFLNLLGNAAEAAGPGGWVEVRIEPAQAWCNIEVTDSGPGPPADVASRLFEPFVTSKEGGVGLGLAVGKQVAEAHGGRVAWRREVDRTCFRIELPIKSHEARVDH